MSLLKSLLGQASRKQIAPSFTRNRALSQVFWLGEIVRTFHNDIIWPRFRPAPSSDFVAPKKMQRWLPLSHDQPVPLTTLIANALQTLNAARVCNKDDIRATDKKSAFNDSHHSPDLFFQQRWIADCTKVAVENAVTAVSDERLARCGLAKPRGGTDRFQSCLRCFDAECDDLYRNRCTCTQSIHQLQRIYNDREAPARGGNNLLVQQRAAKALDEIERLAFHFIRTVDRKINLSMFAERSQRNVCIRRLSSRALRRRNANELQSLPVPPSKRLNCERRRRAGAEPDHHAILHEFYRCFRRGAFECVPTGVRRGSRCIHACTAAVAYARIAAIALA